MSNTVAEHDRSLFQEQFTCFKAFVESQSKCEFKTFASHPFTFENEGYKADVHREAHRRMGFSTWKESDMGSGKIIDAVIRAIEIKANNLLPWTGRHGGTESRVHQVLYQAKKSKEMCRRQDTVLFQLFWNRTTDGEAFQSLVDMFGQKYSLMAYLFFLKDKSQYMPIAPDYFDRGFADLGIKVKTSRRCSWDNYCLYNGALRSIQWALLDTLGSEVSLLDAHSFVWILASAMRGHEHRPSNQGPDTSLSAKDREAVVRARIGQGTFRQRLLDYWSTCAVTGCSATAVLTASHIKPWSCCPTSVEALDVYNGLLLSPNLDKAFDVGYITFDNTGKIQISPQLKDSDADGLAVHRAMKLRRVDPGHVPYLIYHQKNRFQA